MIWALLVAIGVPLWLCALGILNLVLRNRALRRRHGNVAVRVRTPGSRRWRAGHAMWTHDVFAFRGRPAAWAEILVWVIAADLRAASAQEGRRLHRIGDRPVVATFIADDGTAVEAAARAEDQDRLLGAFRQTAVRGAVPSER